MALPIDQDHRRFHDIIRGRIKDNLRRFITKGELIGKQGKELVSIPIPQIDLPRFKFGATQKGGVGQGEGEVGDVLGQDPSQGDGQGQAGSEAGEHTLEVELTLDELAEILGEALALPDIQDKGKRNVVSERLRYTGVNRAGPESLRHFKRTFRQALKRQLMAGLYDPRRPVIIPHREDRRYRTWKRVQETQAAAVIIYMMDVSGSMGDEQKELVRIETFWIDTWLRKQYQGLATRFIIHDAVAREVDRETFFRTRESGGTMISSAYKLAAEIIAQDYPVSDWNIYPFHFSDGDNWSKDDTRLCLEVVRDQLLPACNVFCYGQVESPYGSGQFIRDLRESLGTHEKVILSEIADKDGILDSIKEFLGTGR